jgi:putative tricarboxylic transport membrane protein
LIDVEAIRDVAAMRVNDALLGALLIAFAIALALYAQTFPNVPGQEYGAAVFPTLVAIGLLGSGALLVRSGIRSGAPAIAWADWARERHGVRNVLVTIALVVFYIVASDRLGFMVVTAPILLILLRLFNVVWMTSIAVAVPVTLLIQYLFGSWLYVPLPWGLLAPVRWW